MIYNASRTDKQSGNFLVTRSCVPRVPIFMSLLIGKKVKMDQVWKDGKAVGVTIVSATPNKVTLIRTPEKDGYKAVQIKSGTKAIEIKNSDLKIGDEVTVAEFAPGDKVAVSGLTKGRGFTGVVKRYNFAGGPATHGQKNRHRAPGSIGATAPQRVVKGRRMAGHYGQERVTAMGLTVIAVDAVANTLTIKGAVPGARGTFVEIRKRK
jgi:large subunit ribosomal protein L3